jgi:peptidoglycan/xylan/chitin deacetylase (PgdA/CDA1 family)
LVEYVCAVSSLRFALIVLACAGLVASGCGSGGDKPAPDANAATEIENDFGAAEKPALLPDAAAQSAALAKFGSSRRAIYCGGTAKPWVAFTFDDGPGPYTRKMLEILRRAQLPATFFVVGRNVAPNESTLKAERNYSAPIGDHSWSHPVLTSLSAGEQRTQLLSTKSAIENATGDKVKLFRPPYGAHNGATDQLSRRAGMATILWNVDSQDALGANSKKISRRVKKGLRPGAIILMHENHGQTIRALKYTIIPHLKKTHIRLVTIPQMLAGNPPTQKQLARGRKGCFR